MNRKFNGVLLFLMIFFSSAAKAQIENVIVETYYVSDSLDATDSIGGILEAGSVTYRLYIDLAPGFKLRKIYGDTLHTLKISSTAPFWNNIDRGETYGYDIGTSHLDEGTVALDSYITIGQATKNSTLTYFGILKTQDPDTSIIGGLNNDGGSYTIPGGLISNQAAAAGIPVTVKDGLVSFTNPPTNQTSSGMDSTIFGPLSIDSVFESDSASYQCSDVIGAVPDSNQVLIAQLTTKGELSFELNVVVVDLNGDEIRFVAKGNDTTYTPSGQQTIVEKFSPFLSYPASCGCTNPDYLEYSSSYACNIQSECKTLIVYGCMDPLACNYDPSANFNLSSLCCYPGYCNDRDLAIVCPSLNNERMRAEGSRLHPIPLKEELTLEIPGGAEAAIRFGIYDAYGKQVMHKDNGVSSDPILENVDVSGLSQGLYILRLNVGNSIYTKKLIKD